MPDTTNEKKIADYLGKSMNTLDFNPAHIVFCFDRYPTAVQRNLFDLILTFLNKWSSMYRNGDVEPSDNMYAICQMSHAMTDVMTDSPSTGRHSAPA